MNPNLLPPMIPRWNYATVAWTPPVFPVSKTMAKVGPDDATVSLSGLSSMTMAKVGPDDTTMVVP